jgi:hypothetical protein
MAKRAIVVIDRVIKEKMAGKVDVENNLWHIPYQGGIDYGFAVALALARAKAKTKINTA